MALVLVVLNTRRDKYQSDKKIPEKGLAGIFNFIDKYRVDE